MGLIKIGFILYLVRSFTENGVLSKSVLLKMSAPLATPCLKQVDNSANLVIGATVDKIPNLPVFVRRTPDLAVVGLLCIRINGISDPHCLRPTVDSCHFDGAIFHAKLRQQVLGGGCSFLALFSGLFGPTLVVGLGTVVFFVLVAIQSLDLVVFYRHVFASAILAGLLGLAGTSELDHVFAGCAIATLFG